MEGRIHCSTKDGRVELTISGAFKIIEDKPGSLAPSITMTPRETVRLIRALTDIVRAAVEENQSDRTD